MSPEVLNALSMNVELAALAGLILAVHSLRRRFGDVPLAVLLGGLYIWIQVTARVFVYLPAPFGPDLPYSSIVLFPTLLAGVLVVYAVHPRAGDTWRLLCGFSILSLVHIALQITFELAYDRGHAINPVGRDLVAPDVRGALASVVAICADCLAMAVTYQFVSNRSGRARPWLRSALAVATAILVGLLVDGLLYPVLSGRGHDLLPHLTGKVFAGILLGVMVGPYVAWSTTTDPATAGQRGDLHLFGLREQLQRAESELAASENRYRNLLDALPDGALISRGSVCLYANPAFARICDRSLDELRSFDITTVFNPDVSPGPDESADPDSDTALGSTATHFLRTQIIRKSGKVSEVEAHVCGIIYEGEFAFLSQLRDVTGQRRDQESMEQALRLELLGAMAGGVAHLFNNELSGILGYAELAQGRVNALMPELASDLDQVVRSAKRGAEYSQRLLGFTRRADVESSPLDAAQILEDTRLLVERTLDSRVRMELRVDQDLPVIYGIEGHFRDALMQMSINAIEAMPLGGVLSMRARRISRADWPRGSGEEPPPGAYGDVLLEVVDQGEGIPAHELNRIFDPLFTTKERRGGTGLGMATVYNFVHVARGRISVSSAVGVGTTILIFLPGAGPNPGPRHQGQLPASGALKGRVLYVDDVPALGELARRILAPRGVQVVTVTDRESALDAWREQGPFDLVLLDLILARGSGYQVFADLRQLAPSVPVIFTSGYSGREETREVMHDEHTSFLAKPFTAADLLGAVGDALRSAENPKAS